METIVSQTDKERIKAAIGAAEAACGAEIVTIMAKASDSYTYIAWMWAALGALAFPALVLALFPEVKPIHLYGGELLVFMLLITLFQIERIKMALIPRSLKRHRAALNARHHFMLQQVHKTMTRASVMLFVSHGERYVEILTDTAVAEKIPDAEWEKVVARFVGHVREGRVAEGYIEAIGMSAKLLSAPFPSSPEDVDALPNRLIEV